jgi:geranylgeranyl reductase
MYVGDDVSPDFYGWVFPKYDHVAVGTGTVVNKTAIKQYQQATRDRARAKTEGGTIIRVEAHPIPEHPRPRRVAGRVGLVGDAAGYVTKCSGEGIYFAAKSGRMAAEAIVKASAGGKRQVRQGFGVGLGWVGVGFRVWFMVLLGLLRFGSSETLPSTCASHLILNLIEPIS